MFSLRHRLILSLLLLLIFLFVTPVVQAMPADITGHWVEDSVKSLIDQGILNGYPDGSFRPDQSITRAELAKTLAIAYEFKACRSPKVNSPIRKGTGRKIILKL